MVYIADGEGTVRRTIVSPEADVLPDEFDYRPNKVIVDGAGVIYVLSKGTSGGALQFDSSPPHGLLRQRAGSGKPSASRGCGRKSATDRPALVRSIPRRPMSISLTWAETISYTPSGIRPNCGGDRGQLNAAAGKDILTNLFKNGVR